MVNVDEVVASIKKTARESINRQVKNAKNRFRDCGKLVMAGIIPVENVTEDILRYGNCVRVTREQLPAIRKVFGQCEITGKDVGEDGKTIDVRLQYKKLPAIRLVYNRPYDAETSTCKIVDSTYTNTTKVLQCSR